MSSFPQRILEKPLEKKAGRNYGPPGSRKLIYFVDDMNMPEVGAMIMMMILISSVLISRMKVMMIII